jgi:hypothetical protein
MNSKLIKKLIEWLFFLGLFYFVGFYFTSSGFFDDIKFQSDTEKTIAILGSIVMVHFALAIHELGHLLTGLIQGFRFEMYVVGFLGVKRDKEKIKLFFNKNLSYYGGIAATTPIDNSEKNANKFANILIAGPISSLLFAVLFTVIAYTNVHLTKFVFFIGGLASLGIFFATTIPSKTGMFFTDRKRYQRLIKQGKSREIELAMLRISGLFAKENSYKEIAYQDIELLIVDNDPLIKFFGLYNAICFQIEVNGTVDSDTLKDYSIASKKISKNIVTLFDKEIDKYKEKNLNRA